MSTMVTVLDPPESRLLTTTARAAAGLGITAADGELDNLIAQASEAVATYCGREFAAAGVREIFPDRGRAHWLSYSPVVTVEAVTGVSAYTLVGNALYAGKAPNLGAEIGPAIVEYEGGYTLPNDDEGGEWTLPADVERAVILLVGGYRGLSSTGRDPSIKSERVDGVGEADYWVPGSTDGFPVMGVEALLAKYKRPAFA